MKYRSLDPREEAMTISQLPSVTEATKHEVEYNNYVKLAKSWMDIQSLKRVRVNS